MSTFLNLPAEITSEIIRYSLSVEHNRIVTPVPAVPPEAMDQLFASLEKPLTLRTYIRRSSHPNDVGCPTSTSKCILQTNVLGTCHRLHDEGIDILYRENKFLAVHTFYIEYRNILEQFGIGTVWGPFRPLGGKVISPVSEHMLNAETRAKHTTRLVPVITFAVGHARDRTLNPYLSTGKILILPLDDRDRVLQTLHTALRLFSMAMPHVWDRPIDVDQRWLRVYLRSNLHIPGLCHNGNALARLVLEDVVPMTRHFVESIRFGRPGAANARDRDRQRRTNQALSTHANLDLFQIAYANAEGWLERKEGCALQSYLAGDMARAEELFLQVDERARGFIRYGYRFDNLTIRFPIHHNRIMLYSSVALYHLCKIRANPANSRVYADNPYACLVFAAEHGIIALDLPSPVPTKEWRARICFMLCPLFDALGDQTRTFDYLDQGIENVDALARVRKELKWPSQACLIQTALDACPSMPAPHHSQRGRLDWVQFAKACEVDHVMQIWGEELSSTSKNKIWRPYHRR